jgi:hypothetical protein
MDVTINETEINVPTEITTWGDLLDWIETDYLKAGQCITHVFMAGNENCNYRDQLVCKQALNSVGSIAIRSGDFDTVVANSLAELDVELKNALNTCGEIVRLLENRDEKAAYEQLAALLDSIGLFFSIFSEDLGWAETADAEISRGEFTAVLSRALSQLIAAQENHYWVSICDVLEYEITPILECWQKLVGKTREYLN